VNVPAHVPAHFKEQLADELHAHPTVLPAPAGHGALLRPRTPGRRIALTLGVAATAAAAAVALPPAAGSHGARQPEPAPPGTSGTFPTGAHRGAGRAMLGSGQVREGARRLGR
jgi:hypothetical protein